MRYFTPELLRRTRSPDEDVAEAASREWDDRLDDYAAHLKALRRLMPIQAKRAVRTMPSLHDADFLGYLVEKTAPRITLVVRLEGNKSAEGKKILKKSGLKLSAAASLEEAAQLIVAAVRKS